MWGWFTADGHTYAEPEHATEVVLPAQSPATWDLPVHYRTAELVTTGAMTICLATSPCFRCHLGSPAPNKVVLTAPAADACYPLLALNHRGLLADN